MRWHRLLANYSDEALDSFTDEIVDRGFDSILDLPMDIASFALRVAQRWPKSRVVLTVRSDTDVWFQSFQVRMREVYSYFFELGGRKPPRTRQVAKVFRLLYEQHHGFPLRPKARDAGRCIKVYERHNLKIRHQVPADRLLEFYPEQGWEPLCRFLDKQIPDIPYPHINAMKESMLAIRAKQKYGVAYWGFIAAIFCPCIISITWWLWHDGRRLMRRGRPKEAKAEV